MINLSDILKLLGFMLGFGAIVLLFTWAYIALDKWYGKE